jgi:hypothetical protein
MKRVIVLPTLALGAALLGACGGSDIEPAADATADAKVSAPQVSFKPSASTEGSVSKPGAPFTLQYKVIGTPVVGVPVPIELRIISSLGPQPIRMSYAINDTSALEFPAAQPASVNLSLADNEDYADQMITVIPQREGRVYVNVTASVETESGSRSMVMAVPIQVGGGVRQLEENGELGVDEQGEAIRSLPASED